MGRNMESVPEEMVFQRLGSDGFKQLIAAFYEGVKADPILSPLYPQEDLAGAEERLRDFVIQRFGGPSTYSQKRGHPRLRMRHAPFAVTLAARNRWMELMEQAMAKTNLPVEIASVMRKYFDDAATHMINQGIDS